MVLHNLPPEAVSTSPFFKTFWRVYSERCCHLDKQPFDTCLKGFPRTFQPLEQERTDESDNLYLAVFHLLCGVSMILSRIIDGQGKKGILPVESDLELPIKVIIHFAK